MKAEPFCSGEHNEFVVATATTSKAICWGEHKGNLVILDHLNCPIKPLNVGSRNGVLRRELGVFKKLYKIAGIPFTSLGTGPSHRRADTGHPKGHKKEYLCMIGYISGGILFHHQISSGTAPLTWEYLKRGGRIQKQKKNTQYLI